MNWLSQIPQKAFFANLQSENSLNVNQKFMQFLKMSVRYTIKLLSFGPWNYVSSSKYLILISGTFRRSLFDRQKFARDERNAACRCRRCKARKNHLAQKVCKFCFCVFRKWTTYMPSFWTKLKYKNAGLKLSLSEKKRTLTTRLPPRPTAQYPIFHYF